MKIVVVTASIAENRRLTTPALVEAGIEFVCFTERQLEHPVWTFTGVERNFSIDPCRDAKRYKVLVDRFVEADFSIWIDRHCRLTGSVKNMIGQMETEEAELGLVRHPRRCIYHEARTCKARKKDDPIIINAQMAQFRSEGWPPRAGLFYGGFLIRRHTEAVRSFNRLWWELIEAGSRRDQLSLPVAVKRSGVKLLTWPSTESLFKIGGK